MQQNTMKTLTVLIIILCLSFQNNFCQDSQSNTPAPNSDQPKFQSPITEFFVEFCDYQKFSEMIALIDLFIDAKTQDSLRKLGDKLGVKIDMACYIDPSVNSFWPNLLRGIVLAFPNNDNIIIQLKYMPDAQNTSQDNSNPAAKKYYTVQANVTGNQYYNLKLLKYYLDYNLKNKITLDPNDIQSPVFFSLNSFLYGRNKDLLCDISPVKVYISKAIDALKAEIVEELNAYDKESQEEETDNTGFTVNSYMGESNEILMISSIPRKFTLNEIEKLKDDPYFGQLFPYLDEFKKEIERRRLLLPDLDKYYSKEKTCQLVNEIESEKEKKAKDLYDLINKKSPEDKIIDWLKPYLEERLSPAAQ